MGFWNDGKQNGLGKFIKGESVKYGIWNEGKKEKWFNNEKEFSDNLNPSDEKYSTFFRWDITEINKFFDIEEKNDE